MFSSNQPSKVSKMVAMIQPPTQASSFNRTAPWNLQRIRGPDLWNNYFGKLLKTERRSTLLPFSLVLFCKKMTPQQHHCWAECRLLVLVQTFSRSMLHMPIFEWRERENQQRHEQKGESCRIHGYFDVNRLFWGWKGWFLWEIWVLYRNNSY